MSGIISHAVFDPGPFLRCPFYKSDPLCFNDVANFVTVVRVKDRRNENWGPFGGLVVIITINSKRNYHSDARRRCLDRTARCVNQFRFVNRAHCDGLQLVALFLRAFDMLKKKQIFKTKKV